MTRNDTEVIQNGNKKYIIYCRKSSEGDERQALSLPAQEREMKDLAIRQGLSIREIYTEAKSARKPNNRPMFNEMLARIKKGEAQGIIVWAVNRLARNWSEAGMLMQLLTDKVIEEIITPERTITIDNSNDIVLGVEFGASSQYSKELSKNIKRGLREKVERGQYTRPAPNFYYNYGTSKFDKNIKPREDAHLFAELVEFVIKNNATYAQATQWLNERGLKTNKGNPFYKSSVQKMLQNPVYCGRYKQFPEKKGLWDPLISEATFKDLQRILGERVKPRHYSHSKGYRGLIKCAHCGCAITCTHKIKNGRSYIYYHCTKRRGNCPQKWITEEQLEDQVFEHISRLQINDKFLKKCQEQIKTNHQKAFSEFNKKKQTYYKKIKETDKMLDELMDMRLKRLISQEDYEHKKSELNSTKDDFKDQVNDRDFDHNSWVDNVEKFFEICHSIEDVFNNGTIDQRSRLVNAIGWNLELDDRTIRWNYRKPWSYIISQGKRATDADSCTEWWRWGC